MRMMPAVASCMRDQVRRGFARRSGLCLIGILAAGLLASCSKTGSTQAYCIPTEVDALGPYYVAGTAVTDSLNRFGKPGELLLVEGKVLSSVDGHQPIADARIEVWQTDGEGNYFPEDNGHVDDYGDDEIDLRGTAVTDITGLYRYETVVPGAYIPRPRHLHYRITAPGYQTLVTQLYMTGDRQSERSGADCRQAPLEATDQGFSYAAPTIYLQPE